jgi:hypothetical protein
LWRMSCWGLRGWDDDLRFFLSLSYEDSA